MELRSLLGRNPYISKRPKRHRCAFPLAFLSTPPANLIVVLPIVGRMRAANTNAVANTNSNANPDANVNTDDNANAASECNVEHSAARVGVIR